MDRYADTIPVDRGVVRTLVGVGEDEGSLWLISPGTERCVGQELDQEDVALFYISPNSPKNSQVTGGIDVTIMDPSDGYLLKDSIKTGEVREVSKNIAIRGVYEMCFENKHKDAIYVIFQISFKNRGVEQLKKEHDKNIPAVERRLAAADVLLHDISKEIDFAKRQEFVLKDITEATNARIEWFSYLSIFVLIATALWQLMYLRNFFSSKKLL